MYPKSLLVLAFALSLWLTGCASNRPEEAWPAPRPLNNDIPTFRSSTRQFDTQEPQMDEPAGTIVLRQALALALMKNPELKAFYWEARAREAAILQAGLISNPTFNALGENFGGLSGPNLNNPSQTTIQLSQLIELGGKRAKRVLAASTAHDLSGWDYETKRIAVMTEVYRAFIDLLSAQQRLTLADDMVRLAEQVAETVSNRVEAGKVSPVEKNKTSITLSLARIEVGRAKQDLDTARKNLGATWGNTAPSFKLVDGNLESIASIPSLDRLTQHLSQNPELARWSAEISQRRAVIEMEESKAIPSVTFNGGYRQFYGSGPDAFVAGITVPLPIFDRNQGKIQEARHRLAKGEEERKSAETRVNTSLNLAYRALSNAYTELMALKSDVLPRAKNIFDSVNEGYRLGKFGLLDVLDSQRTLFESKIRYLYAVTAYHKAVAEIEQTIGERLDIIRDAPIDK